ncbi:hypothetical protein KSF_075820 [Reticulibacter mediterranei]|uniref:Uncharacterized protein n=1 Tax=Reticulibacter mediterranei TaxID=2778369 RepID=A0A8J3ITD5_9CHLR|nr:hypothetical protein [Reticulibacter mediterranei]GHO97534.1 hypothetical protein KSF_075820 [Reticulibacter mediterranei]
MSEGLVSGFFGIWALLCVLVYIPRFKKAIRQRDWFKLVPEWRFFAPRPAQGDFHLLYQDTLHDGSCTNWTEARPMLERSWWNIVWNPGKRERKALFDVVNMLNMRLSVSDKALQGSIAYLMLLNYISSLPRSLSPAFTRFLLMKSHGAFPEKEPDILFISGVHEL